MKPATFHSNTLTIYTISSCNLCLRLLKRFPVPVLFVIISKPTISNMPLSSLRVFPLMPHIRLLLTIVPIYKLFLLTWFSFLDKIA